MGREQVGIGIRHQGAAGYSRDCVAWMGHRVVAVFMGYISGKPLRLQETRNIITGHGVNFSQLNRRGTLGRQHGTRCWVGGLW